VPTDDFAQLSLQFVDQTQWRYEAIRPLVLLADRTLRQRAAETSTQTASQHPLPPCATKPTVLEQCNPLNVHMLAFLP
jgi:hypothetical protein